MTQELHRLRATNARMLASVRALLADQPPTYGSADWHALPADHPDRMRAVWQAAEAWRRYWTHDAIADRLHAELDQYDRVWLDRHKAMTADVSAGWDPARHCTGPSFLELQLRRAIPSRGEPSPTEADRIAHLTTALAAVREALADPAVSVRDAQHAALTGTSHTPFWRTAA